MSDEKTDYTFTCDWFSNNIPIWEQVLEQFKTKPTTVLEIGSYEGRSATWLLDNILLHEQSKIFCCDPFVGSVEHNANEQSIYDLFVKNTRKYKNKVVICRGYSYNMLKETLLKNNKFDIIYIDGDHYPYTVLEDAVLSFRLLKYGGVMIFDDYEWKGYSEDHSPKAGVDAFVSAYKHLIDVVHVGYQYIIQKKQPQELDSVNYLAFIYDQLNSNQSIYNKKELRVELTSVLFKLGRYQDAIKHCDDLIKEDSKFWKSYKNKAVCLYHLQKVQEAIDTLKDSLDLGYDEENYKTLLIMLEAVGSPDLKKYTQKYATHVVDSDDTMLLKHLKFN